MTFLLIITRFHFFELQQSLLQLDKKIQVKHNSSPNLVFGFSSPALTSCKFTIILLPSLTMNHSVHKPSRWIVDSNPCDFRANNNPHLAICARPPCPLQGTWRNVRRTEYNTQNLTARVHVKHNVVTVKGSHRALLWVFSISGKYDRIFPRYPDHRCPAAACTNTSKATRNCNGDARETFGIDSS